MITNIERDSLNDDQIAQLRAALARLREAIARMNISVAARAAIDTEIGRIVAAKNRRARAEERKFVKFSAGEAETAEQLIAAIEFLASRPELAGLWNAPAEETLKGLANAR